MDDRGHPHGQGQMSRFGWLRIGTSDVRRSFDLIIDDLGGPDAVSAMQAVVAKLAASTGAIIKLLDEQLSGPDLSEPQASPAMRCRQLMAESLARYLDNLGLTERAREVLRRYDSPSREGRSR